MTEIRWYEEGKPHMRIKENKGVTWLSYQAFEQFPDIVHAFSTRLGGVSQGIYSSMNLSFTRGDEDAAVHENYRRLAEVVGFSAEDIVTSDQTHTANVRVITEEDRGNGITKPRPYGCRWNGYKCSRTCTGNILCGLRAVVFCGSGTSCNRTVAFRVERNCCEDWKSNGRENE